MPSTVLVGDQDAFVTLQSIFDGIFNCSSVSASSSSDFSRSAVETPAPASTTSSLTSGSASANGSLIDSNSSVQVVRTSTGITVPVILGIAGAVVMLVILVAMCVVYCQRRQHRKGKLDQTLLGSPDTQAQTAANITDAGTFTGGTRSHSSAQSQSLQRRLWNDEAIVSARIPREKVISEVLLSRGGYGEVYRDVYND